MIERLIGGWGVLMQGNRKQGNVGNALTRHYFAAFFPAGTPQGVGSGIVVYNPYMLGIGVGPGEIKKIINARLLDQLQGSFELF